MSAPALEPPLDFRAAYPFGLLNELLQGIAPRANREPILLHIGEPQHEPPALIAETIARHSRDWGRYPPAAGTPQFRAAAKHWLVRRYGLRENMIDADRMIVPVPGTREALFFAALALMPLAKAGARPMLMMPNPYYHVYAGAAIGSRSEPVYLAAGREQGFLPDLTAIPAAVLARAGLFFLCSPANPQGAIADLAYLKHAIELARRYGFVLVVDECYAEIFDRKKPPGVLEAAAELGQGFGNLLAFHSLSKRSSAPGLRCGFVCGAGELIEPLRLLLGRGGAGVPLPALAAGAALYGEETHVDANRTLYRAKFDLADRILGTRRGYYRPEGGFFLWLEVGDDIDVTRRLWREAAIKVLPGSFLAQTDAAGRNPGKGYIRVALVYDLATTEAALTQIAEFA
jgi:N-succinyldiaminopimelate aminotransferase